ncbi:MAG: RNA polymerase sigma factor [bacterium]|nr:RNA polymerase sigma factor [bacterium]
MSAEVSGLRRRRRNIDEAALRDLMVCYQKADSSAADKLIRQLTPLLFGFLSNPNHSRTETEDLVQECWLRIHKSRHTYRSTEPVLPWIFAIARHTSLDGYRRRRRIESREIMMETLPEKPQKPEAPIGIREDLARYVDQLPPSQREVILMLKVAGMSLEEVARATSCTVGSVKQKAHRAYEKLRRLLGESDEYSHRRDHKLPAG